MHTFLSDADLEPSEDADYTFLSDADLDRLSRPKVDFLSVQDVASWVIPQLGDYASDFDTEGIATDLYQRVDSYEELGAIPQDELNAILQAHDISA